MRARLPRSVPRTRHTSAGSGLPPTLVPRKHLLPVLAGGDPGIGWAPMHVGVKQVTESGEISRFQGDLDLLRQVFGDFELLGHRPSPEKT